LAIWEGCLDWAKWGWRESNDSSSVASWSRMSIAYSSVSLFEASPDMRGGDVRLRGAWNLISTISELLLRDCESSAHLLLIPLPLLSSVMKEVIPLDVLEPVSSQVGLGIVVHYYQLTRTILRGQLTLLPCHPILLSSRPAPLLEYLFDHRIYLYISWTIIGGM
jgi:hypothetical protein